MDSPIEIALKIPFEVLKYNVESMGVSLLTDKYSPLVAGGKLWCLCSACKQPYICGYTAIMFHKQIRCKNCSKIKSSGAFRVEQFLEKSNLRWEPEYRFSDCRNKLELPFDFAVLDSNQSPILLIEFDGKQHFEPVDFFGGQKGFEYRKQNDRIKDAYCAENNITLLRIPYWEYGNIERLITDKLYELNTLQKTA